jgi:hypothetical protein
MVHLSMEKKGREEKPTTTSKSKFFRDNSTIHDTQFHSTVFWLDVCVGKSKFPGLFNDLYIVLLIFVF